MATPQLGADVKRILVGNTLSALGRGFTLPFLFIYFTDVRDISVATSGLLIASTGVWGFLVVPLGGTLIDRIGSWWVLLLSLVLAAVGTVWLGFVQGAGEAFAALAVMSIGMGLSWPAQSALVASIVPPRLRPRAFASQFALLNLGIGLGGAVSGLLVDVDRVSTFQLIYIVDALSFLVYAAVLLSVRHVGRSPEAPAPDDTEPRTGYLRLLQDRTFVLFALLSLVLMTAGYAQIESGLPAFVTDSAGVSTRTLGFGFAANTAVIVLGQLLVQRRLQGHRRTHALAGAAVIMAGSWVLIGTAALLDGRVQPAIAVMAGMAVFGMGETLLAPTNPVIVNDLAPPHLRGRYNAAFSFVWNVGAVLGPVLAGVLLELGLDAIYIGSLIGGCLLFALLMVRFERRLTPEQNGVFDDPSLPGPTVETPLGPAVTGPVA